MSVIVIVNSFKVPPKDAIQWCQEHMPERWSRHSVPSPEFEGMYQFNKTAYVFDTKEDALLFKMEFPSAGISDENVCNWHGWTYEQ